jgi:hypothetical protein
MEKIMQVRSGGRDEMGVLIELHPEDSDTLDVLKKASYVLKRAKGVIATYWQIRNTYIVVRIPDPQWRMPPEQALELVVGVFAGSRISLSYE